MLREVFSMANRLRGSVVSEAERHHWASVPGLVVGMVPRQAVLPDGTMKGLSTRRMVTPFSERHAPRWFRGRLGVPDYNERAMSETEKRTEERAASCVAMPTICLRFCEVAVRPGKSVGNGESRDTNRNA